MSKQKSVNIISKFDYELSKNELRSIFRVYNECFYENQSFSTKQEKLAYLWLGKSKTWQWYLARDNDTNQIVGIAAYCYSYHKVDQFDLRSDLKENICSVGVKEKYRNLGIGSFLMKAIIEEHGSIQDLTVEIKQNAPNHYLLLKFYHSLGFQDFLSKDQVLLEKDTYLRYHKTLI